MNHFTDFLDWAAALPADFAFLSPCRSSSRRPASSPIAQQSQGGSPRRVAPPHDGHAFGASAATKPG